MLTVIRGSQVIDPAAIRSGVGWASVTDVQEPTIRDLWIRDESIIEPPPDRKSADRTIDASGCVTMAGGIDLHTHIGGGKLGLARLLLGDQMPPWRGAEPAGAIDPAQSVYLPSAPVTAARYLDMGYTTCFEPAMIPCNARAAHAEMADVRGIDTGGYCLLGNDDVLLRLISEGAEQPIINAYVAWMVTATRCLAVKVVNPGGISAFKFNQRELDVDAPHPTYNVTPAKIIRKLCRAVFEIGLAHPLHVHASNLGTPGNIDATLATIRAADGYPIHLTHVQFHCYGRDGKHGMSSAADRLVAALQQHPNATVDVGQIQFGRTVTISADSMHQYRNHSHAKPRKSILLDIECEAGCGVVPFRYQQREFVHSLQWAIGLELFLMIDDPRRVYLTTDHPNGGPFTTYPHLIGLLTNRTLREQALDELHPDAVAASSLRGIDREYSLSEIAIMTRSAPAAVLGLADRGRLSPGRLADVVIYGENQDRERMFQSPRIVMKAGRIVRQRDRDGHLIHNDETTPDRFNAAPPDRTLAAEVETETRWLRRFRDHHARHATFAWDRLWIEPDEFDEVLGSCLQSVSPRKDRPVANQSERLETRSPQ